MRWLLLLIIPITCFSQPDRFWHGGGNYRLDYNTNPPTVLVGGCLNSAEGTACISDPSGAFLFATDGVTVYNNSCAVMTNGAGLFGGNSSSQSAIIVQKPGSTTSYFIFTAAQDITAPGICYSEVDMTLSAGLGAVTTKNVNLTPYLMCEKLTAVRHCNNVDVWVIAKRWNSSNFLAWRISPAGVDINPVISASGVSPSGVAQSSFGQLKANSEGNKLIAAYYGFGGSGMNTAEVYNFNNSTGVVSGAINLGNIPGAYGCEFSPNSQVAYVATNGGILYSFNLCANNIPASRFQVASVGPFFGSIQADKYGKLIIAKGSLSRLAAIQNPNVYGAGCNFTDNYRTLISGSRMGLPNFVPYYFRSPAFFTWSENCGVVSFQALAPALNCISTTGPIGYLWNFGDNTTEFTQNPTHSYSNGTYTITLDVVFPCYTITQTKTITVTGLLTLFPISHN
jgi:hypothetical protein